MAVVTPTGVVKVCRGVPLSNDYKHTLWFKNDVAFFDYFSSKVVREYTKYNIIRDTDAISVEATYEDARTWNYMYFQNNGVGGSHIYFAFITQVEYVNESTVKLHYEIDVMMSYYWSYTLNQCFVEREHSATDNYYDNLIDEGLEVGEYVDYVTTYPDLGELCILVMSTVKHTVSGEFVASEGRLMNEVYSGVTIYAFEKTQISNLNKFLTGLDDGYSDAIIAMWMYPKSMVEITDVDGWAGATIPKVVKNAKSLTQSIIPAPTFDGYAPRNKKLYSFPYNFIYVSNNAGDACVYRHELALPRGNGLTTVEFNLQGAISPESSVTMYPTNYRKKGNNFEEGITLGAFPTCAWNSDAYKLWLAQNQNQQNLQTITAGVSIAGGIALMAAQQYAVGAGAILGGAGQIASLLAQRGDKDIQPPESKGRYAANLNVASGYQTFAISRRTITAEHAKIIDDYFTRFGYACREIKTPNRHARKSFTYVKTVDCQITANLSHEIIQKIESVYDNGVTFWSDPSVIGVYTCDNSCL